MATLVAGAPDAPAVTGLSEGELWARVEEIISGARSIEALRHHGVELIAANLWRRQGLPVPAELRTDEHAAALKALGVPVVLKHARAAYDGALVLMKGPEVGARYPAPTLRPFCDLDLLVDEPAAAHRAMVAAGFLEAGEPARYERAHHLRPLAWPGVPLFIELHREPNRPAWIAPLDTAELLELTQPSATGVPGLLAPVPAAHAVLLGGAQLGACAASPPAGSDRRDGRGRARPGPRARGRACAVAGGSDGYGAPRSRWPMRSCGTMGRRRRS